jgi:hypothetical protein
MSVLWVAILAGTMAIFATVSIEKFGGALGGLLGSLPTTIIPASLGFLSHAATPLELTTSLAVVPIGMLINAIFLYTWRVLPSKFSTTSSLSTRLALMSMASLMVWAASSATFVLSMSWVSDEQVFWFGILGQIVLLGFGIWACKDGIPAPKGKRAVSILVLLSRGLLSGLAIGFSAWISGLGYPILAGMASVFPAMFLTTMVSIWLSQGEAVQAGAVGPMMLGSSSVALYALFCIVTFPTFGTTGGVIVAWVASIGLVSIPAWWWLQRQQIAG